MASFWKGLQGTYRQERTDPETIVEYRDGLAGLGRGAAVRQGVGWVGTAGLVSGGMERTGVKSDVAAGTGRLELDREGRRRQDRSGGNSSGMVGEAG